MPSHQFKIGQRVASHSPHVPPGPYVIVALLPLVSGQAHYRVKSIADGHQRALLEAQISPLRSARGVRATPSEPPPKPPT
jgi:hypothetical protein